jgi:FkbM family methyltransferase
MPDGSSGVADIPVPDRVNDPAPTPRDDDLIEVSYRGRSCLFDGAPVKGLERPGIIYTALMNGKFYEHAFLDYIRSLGIEGVYVDVGACIGTHSLFFALMCPSTEVIAFEPRDHLYERIIRNAGLNDGGDKITAFQVALSETREEVTASLDGREWTLECRPLDEVVSGRVDVLKIDVEGMETKVLAGAARTLKRWRPRVFAEAGQKTQYDALVECMARYGYAPTGRVFNATPTYEFIHRPPKRWWASPPSVVTRLARRVRRTVQPRRS